MSEPLPVVLVPGLNCSARLYAEQIPALWRFGPVQVADHTRDDSMDAIATRILAQAPPRFALVGLSMGGYIALTMVRQAPARVAKLALLDTSARPETPEQSGASRRSRSRKGGASPRCRRCSFPSLSIATARTTRR
jgi:pimeloyl-ACP methyl ester carboxylesterase